MFRQVFVLVLLLVSAGILSPVAQAEPVNFERQAITVALTQEPPNLNSLMSTDIVSFFVIGHTQEGLIRYDRRGRIAPGVAESWEQTDDQIVFSLREDAKWSDGSPVTAHDFVFAWQTLNDPKTAAPYASIMRPVKNAESIQKGELPASELGVRADGDFTLVVDLERPCGYCITVMNHGAFYPVKAAFYKEAGSEYGSEVDRLLYNGPFRIAEWVHGARLKMVKNEHYWGRDNIQLEELNVGYITEDNRTRLNLFRDGSIALARLGAETVEDASAQGMRLRTFVTGGMAYIRFNHTEDSPMSDVRLRRAVQLVFDTDEFVNKVIGIPGYKTAYSFFPSWVNGANDKFAAEYPLEPIVRDIPAAKDLIKEIEADTGEIPSITLVTTTSPTGVKIAEYMQGLLKQHLGLDVKVDQQTFKQYLEKVNRREFDLSLASWYPDFDDIVTYADLLASYNENNSGKFNDPEYDRILEVLLGSDDPKVRMAAANDLQRIIQDQVAVIPTAETGSAYLQHPKLRGVVRRVLGADPDYTFARVVE